MAEQNEQEYTLDEIHSAMFAQLAMMFASAAMQQMGKLVSRETGKAEINLEAAQTSIDMLDMLDTKTRGNLTADEEQMLKETLSSLKLTFVEMQASHGGAPAPTPTPEPTSTPAAEPAAPVGDIKPSSADPADDKQPRFHKKY
ncbi:MAG: DUF1844 domain-containing protein [Kiritimatiellaeota bacterium]|nr:DUF1844 domain-containing protein [Kiritimatiellota bacterium]